MQIIIFYAQVFKIFIYKQTISLPFASTPLPHTIYKPLPL